jgi:hypothetical protein
MTMPPPGAQVPPGHPMPPPPAPLAPVPPRPARSSKGCLIATLVVVSVFVLLAGGGTVAAVWYLRSGSGSDPVGRCFPVDTEGNIVSSHGTIDCSNPNALWRITNAKDGRFSSVTEGCGPQADAMSYVPAENHTYCLGYYN